MEAVGARLQACAVASQACATLLGIGREVGANLGQRHVQVSQRADHAGGVDLVGGVVAIPGVAIDRPRGQEAVAVVVAQGTDCQPAEAGEAADGHEVRLRHRARA